MAKSAPALAKAFSSTNLNRIMNIPVENLPDYNGTPEGWALAKGAVAELRQMDLNGRLDYLGHRSGLVGSFLASHDCAGDLKGFVNEDPDWMNKFKMLSGDHVIYSMANAGESEWIINVVRNASRPHRIGLLCAVNAANGLVEAGQGQELLQIMKYDIRPDQCAHILASPLALIAFRKMGLMKGLNELMTSLPEHLRDDIYQADDLDVFHRHVGLPKGGNSPQNPAP